MNVKKFLAVAMASTMVVGSTVTAFAADADGATGTGTNTGHLDTDVFTAVLPTDTAIQGFFDFTIDPENILKTADKYTDGTTAAGASFVNDDLVYFKQASGAEKAYASTSQAANVGAKNYVDVDVDVEATIGDAAEGKTIIPMVTSAEDLEAATTPSLFLQLKVGTKTAAISSSGASVTEKITGQPTNYDAVYDSSSKGYKLQEKADTTWANNTAAVQLVGKVKGGEVASTVVAPTVTLTWNVKKHVESNYISAGTISSASKSVTMTLPDGVTVSGVKLTLNGEDIAFTKGNQYTISGSTLTFAKYDNTWAGGTITVTYSDSKTDVLTCQ